MENQVPAKKNNLPIIILLILFLVTASLAVFFYFQIQKTPKQITETSPTPAIPAPTQTEVNPLVSSTPTSGWKTYQNKQYKFQLNYPEGYQVLTDSKNLYGWPDAVALLYKGGQSYDLAIEVWDSQQAYQLKYPAPDLDLTVKESGGKFITLLNTNKDPEVTQIISTFKFLDQVGCTKDAKICPNGSAVGRIPPDCEFAPCPTP